MAEIVDFKPESSGICNTNVELKSSFNWRKSNYRNMLFSSLKNVPHFFINIYIWKNQSSITDKVIHDSTRVELDLKYKITIDSVLIQKIK